MNIDPRESKDNLERTEYLQTESLQELVREFEEEPKGAKATYEEYWAAKEILTLRVLLSDRIDKFKLTETQLSKILEMISIDPNEFIKRTQA